MDENTIENVETIETTSDSDGTNEGGSILGKVIGAGVVALGGIGVGYLIKHKDDFKQHRALKKEEKRLKRINELKHELEELEKADQETETEPEEA